MVLQKSLFCFYKHIFHEKSEQKGDMHNIFLSINKFFFCLHITKEILITVVISLFEVNISY